VTETKESSMELRVLASANSGGDAFDLRCEVREKLIDFLQREIPAALPRRRQEAIMADGKDVEETKPAAAPRGQPAPAPAN
jgi:hypothetical protein